jgi:hypothetical protein
LDELNDLGVFVKSTPPPQLLWGARDSVSRFAARHDVPELIAAWKACLETSQGMGDAGAAEGCKDVLLVAVAEGGVLSEKPWKAL